MVRRPDAFDARTAFRFEVLAAGGAGNAAISPSPETAYLLLGAGLLVSGDAVYGGSACRLGGWFSRSGAGVMTLGVAGAAAGLLLLFNAQLGLGGGEILRNPYPAHAGVAGGRSGYLHPSLPGLPRLPKGRGDGPASAGLWSRRPADLVIHVPLHAES